MIEERDSEGKKARSRVDAKTGEKITDSDAVDLGAKRGKRTHCNNNSNNNNNNNTHDAEGNPTYDDNKKGKMVKHYDDGMSEKKTEGRDVGKTDKGRKGRRREEGHLLAALIP